MALRLDGTVIRSDRFPAPHAFTTRLGGVSSGAYASLNVGFRKGDPSENVLRNRELAARAAGAPGTIAALKQQVRDGVVVLGQAEEGDALVTDRRGAAIMTYSADCNLLLLADAKAGVVASVHASRPGTRGRIAVKTVEAMRVLGARDIAAVVGPSIGPCCYDLYGPVLDDWRAFGPRFLSARAGKTWLDLQAANAAQLAEAGVGEIDVCDLCTHCRADWFFSCRRDGDETGRFGGIVWMEAR
ncbi:MAG: laccase domain-containing protein [Planctomycetes bacterium]|nr:laccase domain-containing protein [Planctomycetota bacterium]